MPLCSDVLISTPPYLGGFMGSLWISGILFGGLFGFIFGFLLRDIMVRFYILINQKTIEVLHL
jgi:hypothetical protein